MGAIVKNIIKMENIGRFPLYDECKHFDFNKLIPMPEDLNIEHIPFTNEIIFYYLTERGTKTPSHEDISFFFGSEERFLAMVSRALHFPGHKSDKIYELGKIMPKT